MGSRQDPSLVGPEEAEPVVTSINKRIRGVVRIEHLVVALRVPPELHVAVALVVAPGDRGTL